MDTIPHVAFHLALVLLGFLAALAQGIYLA